MRKLITILFFLVGLLGHERAEGQNRKKDIDSLYQFINVKPLGKRIESITEFAWELRNVDVDSALYWTNKANRLINSSVKETEIAYNYHILGCLYSLKGNYEESEKWLMKAYKIRKKHKKEKPNLLATITNLYYAYQGLGKIKEMHRFISEAEKILDEIGDTKSDMYLITVLQMAEMYRELKQPDKSKELHLKAIDIALENKDDYFISMAYTNFGNYFLASGEYSDAIKYLEKAAEHNKKAGNDAVDNTLKVNMAIAYAETGQTDKSLKLFEEIYAIVQATDNSYEKSSASNNLGYFHLMMGNAQKALPLFLESLKFAQEAKAADLIADRYLMISEAYEKLGKLQPSLDYLKMHQAKKDSLLDAASLKQLNEANAKYDAEKKEKKILAYKQKAAESKLREKENQEALNYEKEQSKRNKIIFFAFILVVLIIAGFIFYSYKQKQKSHLALEEKNKKIELQHLLLEEKHKEITDSINYAERIQKSLMATKQFLDENLSEYFILFRPKDVVSGDFYWASRLENGNFCLVAADSTGHGVPGAIMSMLNISSLERSIESEKLLEPNEILNHTRQRIIQTLAKDGSKEGGKDGMDCSLLSFDFKRMKLTFALANNPLWLIRNNELTEYKADKMPVGKHDKQDISFSQQEINLQKNDMIFILTDGFADQFGGSKGKKYKYSNLQKLLLENHQLELTNLHDKLNTVFEKWKRDLEQVDDVCIIGVRI